MGGPKLASDKPKWRSMTSFLKRPFIGVDHTTGWCDRRVLAQRINVHASAGTSAVSFVDEDNSQDQDMQVGDDCEEYAEV